MRTRTIYDVVQNTIGTLDPTADERAHENVKECAELVNMLITDLKSTATLKDDPENSRSLAGKFAYNALVEIGVIKE